MIVLSRLVELRNREGLSQAKLAKILGIPQQQYSRYESGQNEMPLRYLIALCEYYGVTSDWLLGLSDDE